MKTEEQKLSTPDKILNSAQELMLEEGFHGVSVDRIIALSGVSKGTFFYHFKSKDQLAVQLLTRFTNGKAVLMNQFMKEAEAENRAKGGSPLETLLNFIDKFALGFRDNHSGRGCLMAAFSYQLLHDMPLLEKTSQDTLLGWQNFLSPYITAAFGCSDAFAIEISRMMFSLWEGAFVIERIDKTNELEIQLKHFRRYILFIASDANTHDL